MNGAVEGARRHMERSIASTRLGMRRGLSGLACVAYTAPLVGFLGTCWNLLSAFKCLCFDHEYGDVSGGWSETLIPIWLSLLVALPVFWIYRYLCGRVETYEVEMKLAAEELVSCLERRGES